VIVILITRFFSGGSPALVLRMALIVPPIILTIVSYIAMPMFGVSQGITQALAAGAIGGGLIGLITDYYTSSRPVRLVAVASLTGAGTNVIRGLAVGMESVALPLLVVAIAAGDCILKPDLKWKAECNLIADPTCLSPLIVVDLNFTYSGPSVGAINFASYGFRLSKATFPLSVGHPCSGPIPACTVSQAAICESSAWVCREFGP
jgi:hypothetical protein